MTACSQLHRFSLVALLIPGLLGTSASRAEPAPKAETASQAVLSRAIRQFGRSHDLLTAVPMECLEFTEGAPGGSAAVSSPASSGPMRIVIVKEKHGGKCGGNPSTAPHVATLKVPVGPGKVLFINPVSGEDVPLASLAALRKH